VSSSARRLKNVARLKRKRASSIKIIDTIMVNPCSLGPALITGEPIAEMDDNRPLPKRAVQTNPHSMWSSARTGIPVDPGPWWAVNEGRKVRG
jgi:hypothetical protein